MPPVMRKHRTRQMKFFVVFRIFARIADGAPREPSSYGPRRVARPVPSRRSP